MDPERRSAGLIRLRAPRLRIVGEVWRPAVTRRRGRDPAYAVLNLARAPRSMAAAISRSIFRR
jgi:hypothetical protein